MRYTHLALKCVHEFFEMSQKAEPRLPKADSESNLSAHVNTALAIDQNLCPLNKFPTCILFLEKN